MAASSRNIHITAVTSDPALEDRLNNIFGMYENCVLRTVNGEPNASAFQIINGSQPNLVIVEINPERQNDLKVLEALYKTDLAGIPIVAMSEDLDVTSVRKLLHIGITDWLPKKVSDNDLIWSLEKAVEQHPFLQTKGEDAHEAVFYVFLPAAGGVGNSTLAIQFASILNNKYKSTQATCLIDLNFQSGSISDYLNLKPSLQMDEISLTPERLDAQLLEIMLSKHESGLNVLAAPRTSTTPRSFNKNLIETLLEHLSQMFDNVVVDLPRTWFPWTDSVLHGSNELFIVTEFTVPALRYAKEITDNINEKLIDPLSTSVIINKYRQNLFGSGLAKKDAIELLGQDSVYFVSEDRGLVEEAINRGEPLSAISWGNKIDKELGRIINNN